MLKMELRYFKWAITTMMVLFPILSLILRGSANAILYMLVLSGIAGIFLHYGSAENGFYKIVKKYWPINLAMAGTFFAVLINQVSIGSYKFKNFDNPFRIALFAAVFYSFLMLPAQYMRRLEWGMVIGAFLCLLKTYIITTGGDDRNNFGNFLHLIPYTEMAMLLGFFSVLSLGFNGSKGKFLIFFKILAFCAGLYGAYLSQTRGAWLALPIFFLIILFVYKGSFFHKASVLFLVVVIISGACFFGSIASSRFVDAKNDISQFIDGKNLDTSIGVRIQLWHGSWVLFTENPIIGVGREGFPKALSELESRKVISPSAATFPHSHNELLYEMATLGIFGLFAIVAIYFVPAYLFLKDINNPITDIRCMAGMGLGLCLSYFVFGLSDVLFMWGLCNTFYVFFVAAFYAYIVKRKLALQSTAT